jgi:L-asparaginase II
MISGTGRPDLAITRSSGGDWVAKSGADGIQAVGVPSKGLGIAVKVSDGNYLSVSAITIAVLKQLGLLKEDSGNLPLSPWADPVLKNCNGISVGKLVATVRLTFV